MGLMDGYDDDADYSGDFSDVSGYGGMFEGYEGPTSPRFDGGPQSPRFEGGPTSPRRYGGMGDWDYGPREMHRLGFDPFGAQRGRADMFFGNWGPTSAWRPTPADQNLGRMSAQNLPDNTPDAIEQQANITNYAGTLGNWRDDPSKIPGKKTIDEAKNKLKDMLRVHPETKPNFSDKALGAIANQVISWAMGPYGAIKNVGAYAHGLMTGSPVSVQGKIAQERATERETKGLMSRAGYSKQEIDDLFSFEQDVEHDPIGTSNILTDPEETDPLMNYGNWGSAYR